MNLSLVTIIDLVEKGKRCVQAHFHLELKDVSLAHTFTLLVRRHWTRRLLAQISSARWVWARFQYAVASHIVNARDICISKRHSDSVLKIWRMALNENSKTQGTKEQNSVQSDVIELNVGGQVYYTRYGTLTGFPNSLLGKLFSNSKGSSNDLPRDFRGRYFIDRDGFLFRYVLDYLRDQQVVLPDHFPERGRLKREAEYFQLPDLVKLLSLDDSKQFPDDLYNSDFDDGQGSERFYSSYSLDRRYGYITVAFKGVCAGGGREGQSDAKAKKLPRIFISSRIGLAKEVFGDALNENRDTDRPPDRYTCRFYLKFRQLERAFDMLSESGFYIVACNSSLAASPIGHYADDRVWSNYAQYVFYREWTNSVNMPDWCLYDFTAPN